MLNSKKTYYSIREVCNRTNLEPHVLRYWESEFSILRPKKNRAGNRAYRKKDIETVLNIKHLLYKEQYTIPGARKKLTVLKNDSEIKKPSKSSSYKKVLKHAIEELENLLKTLKEEKATS